MPPKVLIDTISLYVGEEYFPIQSIPNPFVKDVFRLPHRDSCAEHGCSKAVLRKITPTSLLPTTWVMNAQNIGL
jgi:hypothetical protein